MVVFHKPYDANGRAVASSDPFVALPDGTLVTPVADLHVTQTIYDDLGRVTHTVRVGGVEIAPVGNAMAYTPVAEADLATDASVRSYSQTRFDAAGRVDETVSETGLVTRSQYDAAGRQTSVTDPLGRVTRFTYDALGRVTATTQAGGTP